MSEGTISINQSDKQKRTNTVSSGNLVPIAKDWISKNMALIYFEFIKRTCFYFFCIFYVLILGI